MNSIDFHRTHDLLVSAGDDDVLHIYDTGTTVAVTYCHLLWHFLEQLNNPKGSQGPGLPSWLAQGLICFRPIGMVC